MKYEDLKGLSGKELAKKQKSMSTELFTLKMKNSLGQVANPMEIRQLRKDLARVHTAASAQAKK
jgi:large subunit ribosomal protein L29